MQLKPITAAGIPAALQTAERYRLLNDSTAAESICRDILHVEPTNQQALVTLLLSLTDQLTGLRADGVERAREVLPLLTDSYRRAYYAGIICERRAKAHLQRDAPGAAEVAAEWLREAMTFYAAAEEMRPSGNDEAILRWNSCVRLLGAHERARGVEAYEPALED